MSRSQVVMKRRRWRPPRRMSLLYRILSEKLASFVTVFTIEDRLDRSSIRRRVAFRTSRSRASTGMSRGIAIEWRILRSRTVPTRQGRLRPGTQTVVRVASRGA